MENDSELGAVAVLEAEHVMDEEPVQITLAEMKDAIAAMKNEKSPRADGLPFEMLRALGECVEQQLLKICIRPIQQRLHQLISSMEL